MFSEIWQTKKNFCDLKSTLKTVDFFPSCKNEIRGSFQQDILLQPHILMLAKRFFQLQFCWEKNDKLQVMFYFREIKCLDIAHLKGFCNLDKTLDLEFYCLKCCF